MHSCSFVGVLTSDELDPILTKVRNQNELKIAGIKLRNFYYELSKQVPIISHVDVRLVDFIIDIIESRDSSRKDSK